MRNAGRQAYERQERNRQNMIDKSVREEEMIERREMREEKRRKETLRETHRRGSSSQDDKLYRGNIAQKKDLILAKSTS